MSPVLPTVINMGLKRILIDESVVKEADVWTFIAPVFWTVSIYDGPERYEQDLIPFSRPQRFLFAVHWYRSEVLNGGHDQFFRNSTGIVWRDALDALGALDASGYVTILESAAALLGGAPSLDRESRQDLLEQLNPDFSDLDERFFALEATGSLDDAMTSYARTHPSAFFFDDLVEMPE